MYIYIYVYASDAGMYLWWVLDVSVHTLTSTCGPQGHDRGPLATADEAGTWSGAQRRPPWRSLCLVNGSSNKHQAHLYRGKLVGLILEGSEQWSPSHIGDGP